jgi:hypothetical protein
MVYRTSMSVKGISTMKHTPSTISAVLCFIIAFGFLTIDYICTATGTTTTMMTSPVPDGNSVPTTINNDNNKKQYQYQSDQFKAPNSNTDPKLVQEWSLADDELWSYVRDKVPAVLDHTGSSSFDEHLKGVQAVLRYWNSPLHITHAGLFHSIYGTEGFQGYSLPLTERSTVQHLIGPKAERLCFIFCMADRSTVDETVFAWTEEEEEERNVQQQTESSVQSNYTLRARPELGRFEMTLTKEEWLDLVELTLADWLEQVEGAATKPSSLYQWKVGEAYSYRRLAYRRMGDILAVERVDRLSAIPKRMLEAVMGTESAGTRHMVQARTPPVSDSAAQALAALRANGENIPEDLTPQPVEELRHLIHHHEEL